MESQRPPMSALGQNQTLKRLHPMSALPPKGDIVSVGFPLYDGQRVTDARLTPAELETRTSGHG